MKNRVKKPLSLLLAVIMMICAVPMIGDGVIAQAVTKSEFDSRLASFKSTQYGNNSTYVNNPSKTGGYQCFGFANELSLWIFGSYPTNSMSCSTINSGWSRTYGGSGVDNLCVGDVVRYYYHSIFITGISGDTIYYAQANVPSGTNKVTYDNSVSRSSLRSRVDSKLTHSGATTKGWVAHFNDNHAGTHTHSYVEHYEAAHPHRVYKKCSCGDWYYTGAEAATYVLEHEAVHPHREYNHCNICGNNYLTGNTGYYDSCINCNMPGKSTILNLKDRYTSGESVSFTWSETTNTTHYNLVIEKMKEDGSYEFAYRENYASSGLSLTFEPGYYEVTVQSYNSNYFYEDGSDWIHTISDKYHFSVESTIPGKPELKNMKAEYKEDSAVKFEWNSTERTTHYNLYLKKLNETTGEYAIYDYEMHYVESGYEKKLPAGKYKIQLQSTNSETWDYTDSDWVDFAVSHTYNSGKITTAATCKSTGVKTYTCTACGTTKTETVAKNPSNHAGGTAVKNAKTATCTAKGYAGDTYCLGCGAVTAKGAEIPATGHTDSNSDGKCDICGITVSEPEKPDTPDIPSGNCNHICHKTGISHFFYLIARIFWKMFKTNKYCSCGAAHY